MRLLSVKKCVCVHENIPHRLSCGPLDGHKHKDTLNNSLNVRGGGAWSQRGRASMCVQWGGEPLGGQSGPWQLGGRDGPNGPFGPLLGGIIQNLATSSSAVWSCQNTEEEDGAKTGVEHPGYGGCLRNITTAGHKTVWRITGK